MKKLVNLVTYYLTISKTVVYLHIKSNEINNNNMKTTVIIKKTSTGEIIKSLDFTNQELAIQYFRQWCDENNYSYENTSYCAGGRGHDFEIEIN